MNNLSFVLMLALFVLSKYSFALDVTKNTVYDACLAIETKNAAADGQTKPKLAAHYLCTIVANDCAKTPDGQQCRKSKRQYGLTK